MAPFGEGAIIRIKLENFVTYDSVEFRPGPSLNVIIGPNGTGKSTIVCAICLGLAGKTNVLGRALQLTEYIKQGQHRAGIEIELHNSKGENHVVKRQFDKEGSNKWSLNGRTCTLKAVEELVQGLNIQVGNLCQFLPQDKVADFAKMTQQELLESTEKAVGPPEMFEQHQRLKAAREKERELELSFTRGQEQLDQERAANTRLEQDVKNYKQKKRHIEKINQLQMKRPWVEYDEKKKEFNAAKTVKEALINSAKAARSQNAPLQKRADAAKKRIQQLEANMKKLSETVKEHARKATDCNQKLETLSDQIREVSDDLHQKRQDERKRLQKLKDLNDQLTALDDQLESLEVQDTQPEIDDVTVQISRLTREITKNKQTSETLRMKYNNVRRDVGGLQNELRDLQDIYNRRLDELRKRHKDTYDAVIWLRENKHLFKGNIYEPMMLIINMKDVLMAKYLESHISFNDMIAFTYEENDDMDLFMTKIRTEQRLRVNMVQVPKPPAASYQAQYPIEKYARFGFHHYLRDMFDCPEAVMRYLCNRYHVHQIPVGDRHTKQRVEEIISTSKELGLFYTANHQYTIKYSRYSKSRSSRCTELKKPNLLAMSFNSEREKLVRQELLAKQAEMKTLENQIRELEKRSGGDEKTLNELRNKKKDLMNKKNERRQLEQKRNMKKDSIARIEGEAMDVEADERAARDRVEALLSRKCKMLTDLQKETRKCQTASEEKVRESLKYAACFHEQQSVEEELREQSFTLRNLERDVEKQKEVVKTLKDKAYEILEAAKKSCKLGKNEDLSEDIKKTFEALPATLEKIDAAIHEEQARADCTFHADENVVKEYEHRERHISRLTGDVGQREQALERHRAEIEEIKTQWIEPLKELIAKINNNFSHFFQRMKCAGEVDLFIPENPDDYEKYGIRIKVLFRSSEELRELTPHHQSGGERSVSTVLYMMALQELTRVPFRCVDEINQGMDPQNERKVFELVVQTACVENSSQYFLLTPKLLPDLTYSDNMTVLCVFNGPYMLDHTQWNMSKYIRRRARFD